MKNSFFLKEGRFQFYQQVFSFCLLNPRVWYCKQQYSTLMMYPPWSKRNNVNKILENFTESKSYKLNRIDLKMNLDDRNQGCLLHTGTCRLLWLFHGLQQISCTIDEMLQLELTTAISLPFYFFFLFINSHYYQSTLYCSRPSFCLKLSLRQWLAFLLVTSLVCVPLGINGYSGSLYLLSRGKHLCPVINQHIS